MDQMFPYGMLSDSQHFTFTGTHETHANCLDLSLLLVHFFLRQFLEISLHVLKKDTVTLEQLKGKSASTSESSKIYWKLQLSNYKRPVTHPLQM